MIGRSVAATTCMACALALSAWGAASASAETTGTTAYTCKSTPGTGNFSDAHCLNKAGLSNYAHVAIEPGKSTELSGTNANTCEETKGACPMRLKVTLAGSGVELEAKKLSLSGTVENSLAAEEHRVTGTAALTLEEATVPTPAVKCTLKGGQISIKPLKFTSVGSGMAVRFEPNEGTQIGSFTLEGGACVLAGEYKLVGTFKGTPTGATIGFTESAVTAEGTLHTGSAFGPVAGIEGQITLSGRSNSSEGFTPLAMTTPGEEKGFAATAYPAVLSGNQAVQHSFAAGTKEIECTESSFSGTLVRTSPTVAITPLYSSCRTELNLPTTATTNGCSYVLHDSGKTSISCPAGKKIQFHVFESEKKHLANETLCTYSIPPQGPIGEVVYEPEGSGSTADLLVKYKVTGISYEVEGPKLQCGSSASNGEYTGSSTFIAKNEKGEQIALELKK